MTTTLLDIARQTKYPPAAFQFVERGLSYTVRSVHGKIDPASEMDPMGEMDKMGEMGQMTEQYLIDQNADADHDPTNSRHITGQQLCFGLRDFAIEQYGLLARSVLQRWHIHQSEDFGRIVFTLVENELLRKTDGDSIDDFRNVFDFNDAFSATVALGDTV